MLLKFDALDAIARIKPQHQHSRIDTAPRMAQRVTELVAAIAIRRAEERADFSGRSSHQSLPPPQTANHLPARIAVHHRRLSAVPD